MEICINKMTKPKKGNQKDNQTIHINNQNQNNLPNQQQSQSKNQSSINGHQNPPNNQNQNLMPNVNQKYIFVYCAL